MCAADASVHRRNRAPDQYVGREAGGARELFCGYGCAEVHGHAKNSRVPVSVLYPHHVSDLKFYILFGSDRVQRAGYGRCAVYPNSGMVTDLLPGTCSTACMPLANSRRRKTLRQTARGHAIAISPKTSRQHSTVLLQARSLPNRSPQRLNGPRTPPSTNVASRRM